MNPKSDETERSKWAQLKKASPLVFMFVTIAFAAAACGGSPTASVANLGTTTTTTVPPSLHSNSGAASGPSGNSGNRSAGTIGMGGVTVAFSACMRSHGISDFPDPNSQGAIQISGVDPNSSQFVAAQKACAKYSSGGAPPTPAEQEKALANALKFSECMRSHGISDFPDPTTHSGGGISISIRSGPNSDLNPRSPLFQEAQSACQPYAPFGKKITSGPATEK